MESKLLVRAYNVGFGDCIYVRIPNRHGGFHILIDCGTLGSIQLLRQAIEHLKSELPDSEIPGKKRLDLIVATHRHADHLKGFEAAWFEDIPVPKRGKAKACAILSTERRREETIPDGRLLLELGRRLGSVRNYAQSLQELGIDPSTIWARNAKSSEDFYKDREKPYLSSPQPLRTDLEAELTELGQRYIEVEFEPGDR